MIIITKAKELRALLSQGWELWYVAQRYHTKLHGNWEVRYRNQRRPVSWDAIEQVRRGLKWWRENTEEIEVGRNWCYRLKQQALNVCQSGGEI